MKHLLITLFLSTGLISCGDKGGGGSGGSACEGVPIAGNWEGTNPLNILSSISISGNCAVTESFCELNGTLNSSDLQNISTVGEIMTATGIVSASNGDIGCPAEPGEFQFSFAYIDQNTEDINDDTLEVFTGNSASTIYQRK